MATPVWQEQFSARHDFPQAVAPRVRYAICSTPRSGSHFLGHLMHETGAMGYPLEYMNPVNFPQWTRRARAEGGATTLDFLYSRRTSPNGCFGLKMHHDHLRRVLDSVGRARFLAEYRCIYLARTDLVSQAVSLAHSKQTGSWITGMPELRPARYDRGLIHACLREVTEDNAKWQRFLSGLRVPHIALVYEELTADPQRELARVASFLGVAVAEPDGERTFKPVREGAGVKREWAVRFVEDTRGRFLKRGFMGIPQQI